MQRQPLLATLATFACALSLGFLTPAKATAADLDIIELLRPHATDSRVAPDGTPYAVTLEGPDGTRVIGARPTTQPTRANLDAEIVGRRYFVDCAAPANGDGSLTRPWNDLASPSATTFAPGDHVLLKKGSTCQGTLRPKGSGTATAPIVLDAYGNTDAWARIDGNGVEAAVRLDNQEHWIVRNLEITNTTGDARDYAEPRRGVVVALTDYGTGRGYLLSNLYIHDVLGQPRKDLGGSGGIQFEAYAGPDRVPTNFADVEVAHNRIDNVNRSGINVGSNFRTRPSVGGSINDNPFFAWQPMHVHDNVVSNVGGDGIVIQFASGSLVENNTVYDTSNHHGGVSKSGNNAAVWAWDADHVTFRANHVFATKVPAGTWDGTAFDADYGTTGTVFEYNLTHRNEGGFMLFCGCGGLSTRTVMRYNISLNDGVGGEANPAAGRRTFFIAGQTDAEVYQNTFLLPAGVTVDKGAGTGSAVMFANNVLLAQGEVRFERDGDAAQRLALVEPWRNNLFAGTTTGWPDADRNKVVATALFGQGSGLKRLVIATADTVATGVPVRATGLRDIVGTRVPVTGRPDLGAFQVSPVSPADGTTIADGGFGSSSAWTLEGGAALGPTARSGKTALEFASTGSASQQVLVGANRTYRLVGAVRGDAVVRVVNPRGVSYQASGVPSDTWMPVSTIVRTASDASTLTVRVEGTSGGADDIALLPIDDYIVDGSYESFNNTPMSNWNTGRDTDAVSGNLALVLNGVGSSENAETVVPTVGDTYELGATIKSQTGAIQLGAKNLGGTPEVSVRGDHREYTRIALDVTPRQARFTAYCYKPSTGTGWCDDLTLTKKWDGIVSAVAEPTPTPTPEPTPDPTTTPSVTTPGTPTGPATTSPAAGATLSISGTLAPGGRIEVRGTGFDSNSAVLVELHSTPVRLGEAAATGNGAFALSVVLPATTPPGAHHIVAIQGATRVSVPVTITNPQYIPLPRTEAERGAALVLAALLVAAAVAVGVRLRAKRG